MYYYEKTLLYSYTHLEEIAEQIDAIVLTKALSSFGNFSPCEFQAEAIMTISRQKELLLTLKVKLDGIFSKLNREETQCLEYKYFKRKEGKYFEGLDPFNRNYFRTQLKLLEKLSEKFIKNGMSEAWFNKYYNDIEFFKRLKARIIDTENGAENNRQKRQNKRANKITYAKKIC